MAGIKEIRTRIVSVTNTQKITSAMKMVSAAKLRKAQTKALQMRPYSSKMHEIVLSLSAGIDSEDNVFLQKRDIKKVLVVAVASNGGLCGAFNANIAKKGIALVNSKYKSQVENGSVDFFAIGKKGAEQLKSRGFAPIKTEVDIFADINFETISALAGAITQSFVAKEYDAVEIIYNKFLNAASQEVITSQLLPIDPSQEIATNPKSKNKYKSDFIFEPSKEQIVDEIIPRTLKTQIFQALLESFASEHGARMTAMHKATDNAGTLLRDLKIEYNKARQSSITNEILEIVSGANALGG